MPLSSSASITGTPRVITLPTTTTSGRGLSCAASKPLDELDAQRLELRAHGWIDVLVGPGDAMARGLGDGGDAAHERAADAEDVNVHVLVRTSGLGDSPKHSREQDGDARRSAADDHQRRQHASATRRPIARCARRTANTQMPTTAPTAATATAAARRPGFAGVWTCSAATSGTSTGIDSVLAREHRRHRLHEALALVRDIAARCGTTAGSA